MVVAWKLSLVLEEAQITSSTRRVWNCIIIIGHYPRHPYQGIKATILLSPMLLLVSQHLAMQT